MIIIIFNNNNNTILRTRLTCRFLIVRSTDLWISGNLLWSRFILIVHYNELLYIKFLNRFRMTLQQLYRCAKQRDGGHVGVPKKSFGV